MTSPQATSHVRLRWEIAIILALSLGKSAVYSLLSLLRSSLATTPLSQQQTKLNPKRDEIPIWDIVYSLLDVIFSLAVVALAIYLLWEPGRRVLSSIGMTFSQPGKDAQRALFLAAAIGIPGLGFYALSRVNGWNINVIAAPESVPWWTVVLLLLSALRAGLLEEVLLLGYLFDRLKRLGWSPLAIIIATAVLRGLYHSYQGFGGIIGNIVMGLFFGWCYHRWGRVMPFVVAHTLIDTVAFLGYPLAASLFPDIF